MDRARNYETHAVGNHLERRRAHRARTIYDTFIIKGSSAICFGLLVSGRDFGPALHAIRQSDLDRRGMLGEHFRHHEEHRSAHDLREI